MPEDLLRGELYRQEIEGKYYLTGVMVIASAIAVGDVDTDEGEFTLAFTNCNLATYRKLGMLRETTLAYEEPEDYHPRYVVYGEELEDDEGYTE